MNIAVIGAGSVGETLGRAWARRGHRVSFGVREPGGEKARRLAMESGLSVTANKEAASGADVVVLATPWGAARDALEACGNLAGKILIDCTNPVTPDFRELAVGFTGSGAEQIASWAPGVRVFKTLNQIGSNLMDDPQIAGGPPVMFVCGGNDGKAAVIGLVTELGFDTIDAGDLRVARLLEPFAMLWIHLALARGLGRDIAFALLRADRAI
jgi:predicted dinucleotide-binding enzyme